MPKYFVKASYTPQGIRALKETSAAQRWAALRRALETVGIKAEAMYFSGSHDSFIIADAPDYVTLCGAVLSRAASGDTEIVVTPLLTVDEMDDALKKF